MGVSRSFGELDLGLPTGPEGDELSGAGTHPVAAAQAVDATEDVLCCDDETLPPPPTLPPEDEELWPFELTIVEGPTVDDSEVADVPLAWAPHIALLPPPMVIAVGDGLTIGRSYPFGRRERSQ